ncbi:MAG: hypothetical protein WD066_01290 [Planctomycetaceae bacterium]
MHDPRETSPGTTSAGATSPGATSAPSASGDSPAPPRPDRWERHADFLAHALGQIDPLSANVGAVEADLLTLSHRMMRTIERSLPETLEDFAPLKPALDSLLKVQRMIGRFAVLDAHLEARRGSLR